MAINKCSDYQLVHHETGDLHEAVERVKHENTAWHTALHDESDEFEVPGWEDFKGGNDVHVHDEPVVITSFRVDVRQGFPRRVHDEPAHHVRNF